MGYGVRLLKSVSQGGDMTGIIWGLLKWLQCREWIWEEREAGREAVAIDDETFEKGIGAGEDWCERDYTRYKRQDFKNFKTCLHVDKRDIK